jgi:hypothetical protein
MKTRIFLSIAFIALLGWSNISYAGNGHWRKTHPRRVEVNSRLRNQNRRINKEVKEGEMSRQKAVRLKTNDMKIRQEERDMASQNKGHLTRLEQKTLNRQLNKNSRKIGQ